MISKTRVLIVDDDIRFAESLTDILREKGYEVTCVNSGKEALEEVKKTVFQSVLLDVKMPVMDGVETCKRIKNVNPRIPVIMMTAFSVEELIKGALEEGVYRILYKPLDMKRVMETIERAKEGGILITVVDDNPNTRYTLKDILEEKGYSVSLAETGERAIELARKRPNDIMFIDIKLPIINGLETFIAVKKINPKVIAIMMTGYKQEVSDLVDESLRKGAYTCLYKPFNPGEALKLVEEIAKKLKQNA